MAVKKLIEVALPLEAINAASAREKSIRHGHPSTLHLWWARRPLAAARAVIWASLVDDPSGHPEAFPTEEDQNAERERLFRILEELVVWENSNDQRVLEAARAEVRKYVKDEQLALLDPFAGGGAIPLEAQRLGLKAYAQDLNPVAVTINKAMIEIPPRFAGKAAVNPESRRSSSINTWENNHGLAADVSYYGHWMLRKATERLGHLYPRATIINGNARSSANVIAWLWVRTVKCPNPACGHDAPLATSFDLSTKKGKACHAVPVLNNGRLTFKIKSGKSSIPGTRTRTSAICYHCGQPITVDYMRNEASNHRMGEELMAVVAEGNRERLYLEPDNIQVEAARIQRPDNAPSEYLADNPRWFSPPAFGLETFGDLFTNRQLFSIMTLSDLIGETAKKVYEDAAGILGADDTGLDDGGTGARAYSEAISLYLQFALDKTIDRGSSLCCWDTGYQKIGNTFGRQALPMRWVFAESNPIGNSTGALSGSIEWVAEAINGLPRFVASAGTARQFDAQSDNGLRGLMISTDPPYYDNIDYADLSDYFYVWDRRSLRAVYPKLYGTMMVPKKEELIAAPHRFSGGKREAKQFFESGMRDAFTNLYNCVTDEIPMTVYYGFKQGEVEKSLNGGNAVASSGWETMLSALIGSGFTITGTWPVRTELTTALKGKVNALASSIVLVCRKRKQDAPMATRRDFVNALKRELRPALDRLVTSNITPVDMAQSAIGPGIGVYSRFSNVLEADGSEMTVRAALQIINQELDLYFSDQDSDLDRESRFCVDLYTQCAFNEIKFGEADVLARAKNTSIDGLASKGALYASKGVVRLLGRDELKGTNDWGFTWLFTQELTHAMETGGIEACAKMLKDVFDSRAENAKSLAYRLFTIADKKGWNAEAFAYNSLVVAWPEIQSRAAQLQAEKPVQYTLFDD